MAPYPTGAAPSQRFRFEQYLAYLKEEGAIIKEAPFLNHYFWNVLYINGNILKKIVGMTIGLLKRVAILLQIKKYDFIFIHRELAPFGPPIFEWVIAKVLQKRIIYDFDDAIWLEDPHEKGSLLGKVKWKSKVASICKWSFKISVGNDYLASFALQFNDSVVINPTTIDTVGLHNPLLCKKHGQGKLTIGWTGTHSTLPYLREIVPVLQKLENQFDITFLVIANREPDFELKSMVYKKWAKETEIQDLMGIDIGIMPLTDDDWSKGKCGFKALQYMALNISTCASPVGVNLKIIQDGENGYLCETAIDWLEKLSILLSDAECRKRLGEVGAKTVQNSYSVQSNQSNFLNLFE